MSSNMADVPKTTKVTKTKKAKPSAPAGDTKKDKKGSVKDPRPNVIRVTVRMLPTPVKEEPVEEPEPIAEVVAADPYEDENAEAALEAAAYYASANQAPEEDAVMENSMALDASATAPKDVDAEVADSAAWYAEANLPAEDAEGDDAAWYAAAQAPTKEDDKPAVEAKQELNDDDGVKPQEMTINEQDASKDEKKEEDPETKYEAEKEAEKEDEELEDAGDDTVWDPQILVVRQGQVHIELQHRNPPMHDEQLKSFCDWLDKKLPVVVKNFPYVAKSGAYVDLSDNVIGPEGLDKLFQTLRKHRVPCVVMKCYRNVLDDSIVDTLIEYLYTQPEAYPMHGIHISHNNITDKGAFRLMRAAAQCGHYPRYTTRMPLWLRLECNSIENPEKVVVQGNDEGFNMCLMADGMCSRPNCNHYLDVHVQLPYFYHQGKQSAGQFDPTVGFGAPGPAKSSQKGSYRRPQEPDQQRYSPYTAEGFQPAKSKTAPGQPPPALAWQNNGGKDGWKGGKGWDGWKGGGGGKDGWKGGGGKDGGGGKGWHKNGKDGGGKDGGKKGGKNIYQWKTPLWSGPSLVSKRKVEVKLAEGEFDLGFEVSFEPDGGYGTLSYVDPSSTVGYSGATAGLKLLRLNGLDCGMFSEKQVRDLMKQRPLEIRMGDK